MIISLCLTACGGGSGGFGGSNAKTVSGVAATGAPIAGTIYLRDAAGRELSLATVDGRYTFNVSALTAPFMLKAEWVVNSTTYTLFSAVSGSGTANINPFSNLIVAVASGGSDPAALYAASGQYLSLSANLGAATVSVLNRLRPLLDKYGAGMNPVTGRFSADHTGLDLLFDNVQVTLTAGADNVIITDRTNGALILSAAPASINTAPVATAPVAQSWSNQDAAIANDPDVAVDADGRAIVVWSQKIAGVYSIIARGPADHGAVTISSSADSSWAPKIGIDGSGNAVAVWLQSNNTNSAIWATRYVAGSGWDTAQQISLTSNAIKWANVPQISVDSAGNAVAVWHAQNPTVNSNHFDIFSSRYTLASNSWSAPVILSSNTNTAGNPHVALNASGDGLAVWTEGQDDGSTSNGPMDVWGRRYTSAGGWSGVVTKLNTVSGNVNGYGVYGQTAVAVDSNGNGMAVWVQNSGNVNGSFPFHIWASRFTTAGGWVASAVIANNVAGDCYGPDIAIDASGNAIAVWQQQDGVSTSFAAANRFSGGVWGTSGKISDGSLPILDIHVRADAAGNARAVWYQPEGVFGSFFSTIRSNAYTAGSGWGSAALVSTLVGIDGYQDYPVPRIGMNSSGNSFTVWGIDSM